MELKVADLTCARSGIPILENVSFSVTSGQSLILRGPNGSGKSTLLRTLAGLLPAESGTISAPPESIAYSGHADGLKSTLQAAENLEFWAKIYGTSDVAYAIQAFGLTSSQLKPAKNLSAGQKRRLGLARMLVTGRPIWVMDEPSVSLDAEAVEMFGVIVKSHLESGGIAVIATHVDLGFDGADVLDLRAFKPSDRATSTSGNIDEYFA